MDDEWSLTNWTMEEKGREIIIFFEMLCALIIALDLVMCKIIDFLER